MRSQKWYFIELNKDLVKRKNKVEDQDNCEHKYWIAKCSHCGKVLASEIQNTTEKDIINKVEEKNMINKLIEKSLENWKVILNEQEAEKILNDYPNIIESYSLQEKVFGGIRSQDVLYNTI